MNGNFYIVLLKIFKNFIKVKVVIQMLTVNSESFQEFIFGKVKLSILYPLIIR